ncbi:thioredoxin fold domain-containing protein [Antarctobacter jejuensis]|uniref:thioredoxin fold domain-containing protein n=1 Tax=Antarctobacter jejuensis TaxID=1439938 RepID=UPI003FD259B3
MPSVKIFAASVIGLISTMGAALADDLRLVIVEQPGCAYCAAWNDQIAPAYPNTSEGKFAPLVRADLHMGPPEGMSYARRVNFTPTFILIEDGEEIARMEGYVGEDFFWPIYSQLLQEHTAYVPPAN